jgi:hypothetical protein
MGRSAGRGYVGSSRARGRVVGLVLGMAVLGLGLVTPVGSAHAASADPVTELVQKYAPIVVVRDQTEECGDGEAFRPATVDTVLGKPDVVLQGPDGEQIASPTAADLSGRGEGWYVNLPGNPLDPGCTYEKWFREVSAGTHPTLYAHLATDPEHPGKIALQYWFYYVFNDWNDKHESDWEMVQVVLPAATVAEALAATPESVAFAQHEGSQVSPWEGGSLIKVGDRPVVYPGQGSHAAYYTQATWFGKSAAAGFGCDNTTALGAEVRPTVVVLPEGAPPTSGPFAWLSYTGRWGQQEPSFNNGPTGPVTKTQWSSPIAWQEQGGRTSAVSLPPAPGPALRGFCSLTASGSLLFIDLLDRPALVLGVLLALLVLAIVLARRTAWRHAHSDHPDRPRRAGQILTAAFGWVRRHLGAVLGISAVVVAVLMGSSLVRAVLLAPRPSPDITDVGGETGRWLAQLALVLVALIGVVLVGWVAASIISLVRDDAEGQRPSARAALRVGWAQRSAMVTAIVLLGTTLLLTGSLVLIPVAAYLVARWAVAPAAAVVEALPVRAALRRSTELTSGHRWRALVVQTLLVFVGLSLAGLLGALLLIVTSWPFWVTGMISIGLLALLLPVAFAGTSLHFYDLRQRVGQAAPTRRDGTQPAPATGRFGATGPSRVAGEVL